MTLMKIIILLKRLAFNKITIFSAFNNELVTVKNINEKLLVCISGWSLNYLHSYTAQFINKTNIVAAPPASGPKGLGGRGRQGYILFRGILILFIQFPEHSNLHLFDSDLQAVFKWSSSDLLSIFKQFLSDFHEGI